MELQLFRPLWGAGQDYDAIARDARMAGFDGLEGGLPSAPAARHALVEALAAHALRYIAEICTGGTGPAWWIPPRQATPRDHLDSLEAGLAALARSDAVPLFVNCMAGLDAWPLERAARFFESALALGEAHGMVLAFETHRGRPLYAPWTTQALLEAVPALRLTCDLSHWCVVSERLLDDDDPALALAVERALHVQCRVGHAQGPQVPDPCAPAWQQALAAHQRWWERIWQAQRSRGQRVTTMTPEFGPDGYAPCDPVSGLPSVDPWELNRAMAGIERAHFARWSSPPRA